MLLKKTGLVLLSLAALNGYGQQVAKATNVQLVSSPGTRIVINGGITFTGTSNWKDSGKVFLQKNTVGGSGSENWLDSTAAGVYDINSIGQVNFVSDSLQYIYGNTKFYDLRSASDTGVYLNSDIEVRNQLDLDKGLLYTSSSTKMYVSNVALNSIQSTNNFTSSWVHGRLERALNLIAQNYLFPVGKKKAPDSLYAPIKLYKFNSNTARYLVEYFPSTPPNRLTFNVGKMDHVSDVEYWEISSNIPSGQDDDAVVSLSWRGYSRVSANAAVRDSLLVTQYVNAPPLWWDVPGNWGGAVNVSGPDSLSGYVKTNTYIGSFISSERWFTLGTLSPNNALPVKLLYFTATPDNTKVRLNWKVEQEQDITVYEIEKSLDGIHFSRMSSVLSLQKDSWLYTDYDFSPAIGWNYYRLKSISKTGVITYSGIRKVKFDKGLELVKIFPNPATDVLNVQLPSSYTNKVTLQLYSIDGKFISSMKPASSSVQLNVTPLPGGSYVLRLLKDDTVETYNFIKQ